MAPMGLAGVGKSCHITELEIKTDVIYKYKYEL